MTSAGLDDGSFRDRHARVFYHKDNVYRGLSEEGRVAWQRLASTRLFRRFSESGALIGTEEVPNASVPAAETKWAAVLRHDRIPFVSYPYEWSFGMLQDAALLQLDLLLAALDEGLILKDASAYNVQWRGARPVFIDVSSFEPLRPGQPWVGYQQFCQMLLYPLMLQAYKDLPFQPWLRGSLEGIAPDAFDKLMSARDHLRPGVLLHVHLQARAQATYADTGRDLRSDLRRAGFSVALIRANVRRLRALAGGLSWRRARSTWSDYTDTHTYDARDLSLKTEFVRRAVAARPRRLVWDVGANLGVFSRIAADQGAYVVAIDADHLTSERLYRALKAAGENRILPLVVNLVDPSPGLGWRGLERRPLDERGQPDLVIALALVHHMVIGANVPLPEWMDWLAGMSSEAIVEFVAKDDPQAERLLRNKDDQYGDYSLERFEQLLNARMSIVQRQALGSGTRVLYHAVARSGAD